MLPPPFALMGTGGYPTQELAGVTEPTWTESCCHVSRASSYPHEKVTILCSSAGKEEARFSRTSGVGSSMPKRKNVRSLQRLGLESVARNTERIWFRDYRDNYLGKYNVSSFLLQELLLLMRQEDLLTPALLDTFLVPQLTELQLRICSDLVNETVAQAIAARCKKCDQIPATALADLIKVLPCLQELNLSETQCNTQVLSAVASSCRRLRHLDITDCKGLGPESLFYLAYDPAAGSFCCPKLEGVKLCEMEARTHHHLIWALAFLLLALPLLKLLVHDLLAEAVRLIHSQQFHGVQVPPGFPSLEELARSRTSASRDGGNAPLTLALTEMYDINESSLPALSTVCPALQDVIVFLEDAPGFAQNFLSCRHLTNLTLICTERRDLWDLLPLTASLGGQLQTLTLGGFFFTEELSFQTLLNHCRNLVRFSASFLPLGRPSHGRQPDIDSAGWDFRITPYEMPQLRDFYLLPSDMVTPMPAPQAEILRSILVSLLRYSLRLENLTLASVPFPLEAVFRKALEPPGVALRNLRQLALIDDDVSLATVQLLLSADNQLSRLQLNRCLGLHQSDYEALLERVDRERFELTIAWE
ncbi:hypothetical protein JRQ81_003496 [Phrynocephalus forsythii]|uniref:Uncharacterized protein n=1 Tax=Phrynocephalus forsythii TaxID=171643 RepID=A0A9Q0XJZ9_9SAUR|nr:hypothetical protein JRQ81_003496 [Phrynocephalus forsythii]